MKRIVLILGVVLALAGCGKRTHFNLDGQLSDAAFEGAWVYLVDVATQTPVDSIQVTEGAFRFEGEAENAFVAQIVAVGDMGPVRLTCIVEPGDIRLDMLSGSLSGTQLNDRLAAFVTASRQFDFEEGLSNYLALYRSAATSEERHAAELAYDSIDALRIEALAEAAKATYAENQDNLLGAYTLTLWANEVHPAASELEAMLEPASEVVKNFAPLQTIQKQLQAIENTAAGCRYTDIEGIDFATGETGKLSQLVEGRVALVDFWASWCRPCRQEISENLIRLYKQYGKKGLQIVGVDVWDKPEQHKQMVEQLGITYPQLIDTTRNATTTYGISNIPQILLISADGIIIARNLRGEAIEAAVIEALK